jgi:hypothetical protein
MAIVQQNISAEDSISLYPVPAKLDLTYYRYELIDYISDARVYSDEISEIIEYLTPGGSTEYAKLLSHAVDMQVAMQAQMINFYHDALVSEEEFQLLTGIRHEQPSLLEWNCQVPLILIDSFYSPYTSAPLPYGQFIEPSDNIIWLTPGKGSEEYLKSLDALGAVQFNVLKSEMA